MNNMVNAQFMLSNPFHCTDDFNLFTATRASVRHATIIIIIDSFISYPVNYNPQDAWG